MPCVLFLIDESRALAARVAEGTKSKADCLATALNALLGQLSAGPHADVAVVGYRRADDGTEDAGCRWGGPLEGRRLLSTAELEASPRAVEDRVRKIPGPGGYGVTREETVRFPIWYVPMLQAAGPRRAALEFCRRLLAPAATVSESESAGMAGAASVPPMIVHLLAELADEDGFRAVGEVFAGSRWHGPAPLVFHAHLGSSGRVPAMLYPSSDANLSPELLRRAFQASSILPEPLAAGLRAAGVPLNRGARGLIYNARMVDLIRFLGLVKDYVAWAVPRTSEVSKTSEVSDRSDLVEDSTLTPALSQGERERLVVFVLDRSCATPDTSATDPKSPWRRLQDRANDLIGQLARQAKGAVEIAVVAYGSGPSGDVELWTGFSGPMAGRTWLGPSEVADGAIRIDQFTEQVSNGIGGLLTISRKRPVLFDLAPTGPASPTAAFARVAQILIEWAAAHPDVRSQPVVVHCTRGEFEADAARQSVARLREAETATEPVALYHVILTESAHRATAYPTSPEGIEHDALRTLWELTSPLPGGGALAGKRPGVSVGSRGMVVNAAFDALADAVDGGS